MYAPLLPLVCEGQLTNYNRVGLIHLFDDNGKIEKMTESAGWWKDSYSVGNPVLDAQHRSLLALCQRARACLVDSSRESMAEAHDVLNELADYMRLHFQTEERFLRACNFPGLDQQIIEHRDFEESLTDFLVSVGCGAVDKPALAQFLDLLWSNHILGTDAGYKGYV